MFHPGWKVIHLPLEPVFPSAEQNRTGLRITKGSEGLELPEWTDIQRTVHNYYFFCSPSRLHNIQPICNIWVSIFLLHSNVFQVDHLWADSYFRTTSKGNKICFKNTSKECCVQYLTFWKDRDKTGVRVCICWASCYLNEAQIAKEHPAMCKEHRSRLQTQHFSHRWVWAFQSGSSQMDVRLFVCVCV